ncbi:hypothetical protein [Nakamurella leprariae]|uniref:Uncharacterized protein n=1 Tax=Nakamurella leprariae TaxID=2803911 RepID=A0A939C032_9ACTN|nr:hypothetical protein [Nakamurella leprariae]MBM9465762.1 hypothetical protein [Nakamurella leprariae]
MSSDSTPARPDDSAGRRAPGAPVDLSERSREVAAMERSAAAGAWTLRHLPGSWTALVAGAVVLSIVGGLVQGWSAVLGVSVGAAIVGLFFTVSAVVIAKIGREDPKQVMLIAMITYVIKIVALGVVMVLLPRDSVIDSRWMAGAIGLGVLCWLGMQLRSVLTTKIFYVDAAVARDAPTPKAGDQGGTKRRRW